MKNIHYALTAATACLALAACGKTESTKVTTTTNGSTSVETSTGTQPMSAAALGIKPGKWETTVEITDLKMSGAMANVPKPKPQTVTSCLTPEQASKGPEELLKNANADCTASRSVYKDGKIDVDMTCKTPTGTMKMTSTGTYSPTELTSDAHVETTGSMAMSQTTHTVSRRIGECAG